VASAAPDSGPKSAIAVATASSKKLLAPISAPGAAIAYSDRATHQPVGQRRVEVDLDQDRDRDQRDVQRACRDVVGLEGEDQHQRGEQRRHR
jgi:hypothetical protein